MSAPPTAESSQPPLFDGAAGKLPHRVNFYHSDSSLEQYITPLFLKAFQTARPGILIATAAHRNAFEESFQTAGFDVESLKAAGLYYSLDAADTLAQFMVGDRPDRIRFNKIIGDVIAQAERINTPVLAFGEMVALLSSDGKHEAALSVEQMWNELGTSHQFALWCAYPLKAFGREADSAPFARICSVHSHVIPAESYPRTEVEADESLRTIAFLQQKAAALQAEAARREEVEKSLAREKEELADFLENAVEAIHKVDANGSIIWANRAELELLGYSEDEYLGRHIAEFHADPDKIGDILRRLKSGERLRDYEAPLKHANGSILHVSINSSVYRQNGEFIYTKCFTRDITERKRASELLEKMVSERTAELREVVEELEAFSYSVSHDLRSPLRAMEGYAKAILEDAGPQLDSETITRLGRIHRSAHKLDTMIQDVLAYSRISHGKLTLQPIDLNVVMSRILTQQPALESRKDYIAVDHLHTVKGNEVYVEQCLINLLDNALKFVGRDAKPIIRVFSDDLGDQIKISVCDNGIGIERAHYDRIYRIFSRVHPESRFPGTGIGLATVKKAVKRMGGDVGFESMPGVGSTFWFTLPKPEVLI